jgi:phospholipid transport system substrate-binding protein
MLSSASFSDSRINLTSHDHYRRTGQIRALTAALAAAALMGLMLLAAAPSPAFAQNGAEAATRDMVDKALNVLADKSAPVAQRRHELRELIEPRFDFTEMSRSALGFHWRSLTPTQRADFTNVFKDFIEDAYLSKIQDYSGQKVRYGAARSLGQGYAEVDTQIVQAGKNPIPVNYLLDQKDGSWKIYDVTVDNISIVANYRTQFNRVINQDGFDKLMADLRAKQQQLAQSLGE